MNMFITKIDWNLNTLAIKKNGMFLMFLWISLFFFCEKLNKLMKRGHSKYSWHEKNYEERTIVNQMGISKGTSKLS